MLTAIYIHAICSEYECELFTNLTHMLHSEMYHWYRKHKPIQKWCYMLATQWNYAMTEFCCQVGLGCGKNWYEVIWSQKPDQSRVLNWAHKWACSCTTIHQDNCDALFLFSQQAFNRTIICSSLSAGLFAPNIQNTLLYISCTLTN